METVIPTWVVLTLLVVTVFCNPLNSDHNVEVTYADLEDLGASCYPLNSCQRNETMIGLQNTVNCDCHSSCSMYGTCCVDSEFRINKASLEHKSNLKCLEVYNSPGFEIFMVDTCKNDESYDNLCVSDPEESNDPFLIIPVTSNATGITYKNYFCAVCNEEVNSTQLEFWNLQTRGNGSQLTNLSEPQFKFNKKIRLWTVLDGKSNETSAPVLVQLTIQESSQATVRYCSSNLVGSCSSNWTDDAVAIKCTNYMAKMYVNNLTYKNPHCVLCNFQNVSNLQCFNFLFPASSMAGSRRPSVASGIPLIGLFVLEDRKKRCGKNMVYDKFSDKCRCNARIYKKENGKCVHRI